ncbi:DUF4132 domain-containing protein [Nocardioides sp. NPDC051685]|uniref:DUF4132 domain-containing protein n=1 Tax=Nocardioides sp. NPDC051685 TaxID=3364334 RepID=UPI0037AAEAB4
MAALRTVAATFNQPEAVVDYVVSGDGTIAGLGPADRIEAWLIWGRNQTVFKRFGRDAMLEFFAGSRGRGSRLTDDEAEAWRRFYSGLASVDVAVIGRWANVIETAMDDPALGSVGGRHWLEALVVHCASGVGSGQRADSHKDWHGALATAGAELPLRFADLIRLGEYLDVTPASMIVSMLEPEPWADAYNVDRIALLSRLPDLGNALVVHQDVVATVVEDGDREQQGWTLRLLDAVLTDEELATYAAPLAGWATQSRSKTRREAAEPVLARVAAAAAGKLRELAVDAPAGQRARALSLLMSIDEHREWASATAAADRTESVRRVAAVATPEQVESPEVETDSLPEVDWSMAERDAVEVATAAIARINQLLERSRQRDAGLGRPSSAPEPLSEDAVTEMVRLLTSPGPIGEEDVPDMLKNLPVDFGYGERSLLAVARAGRLSAPAAVKLLVIFGHTSVRARRYGRSNLLTDVLAEVQASVGGIDLLEASNLLDATGADGVDLVWRAYAEKWGAMSDWPLDLAQSILVHHTSRVLTVQDKTADEWNYDRLALYRAATAVPSPEGLLREHLFEVALGSRADARPLAQEALVGDPERVARAGAALTDTSVAIKQAAARWLGGSGDAAALEPLQAAWCKERNDLVRGSILDALLQLGEQAETYLDPEETGKKAAKAVARGLPTALEWLDWSQVPEVRFAATGAPVPVEVVQWLTAMAVKGKTPVPNAILRRYAELFEQGDRERLGKTLLHAWMTEDLRLPNQEEAMEAARDRARQYVSWGYMPGATEAEIIEHVLPEVRQTPFSSGVPSKGMLALAAACGGGGLVDPAVGFVKKWYGWRLAQSRALLIMLAWTDHPAATQAVLAVGTRFRTKSLQQEAATQIGLLAERRGWSVDELADRTIPTAGFDEEGRLELDYGPRAFSAHLLPDLTVELRTPDGKPVKSLPAPRKDDDEEAAKAAKKSLAAAKRELKSVRTQQATRLYEALCTERTWPVADWRDLLLEHPVARHLVTRLLWVAEEDGEEPFVFRPLEDGTLTDVRDEDVRLPETGRIRLAHLSVLSAMGAEAWREHLVDYEIVPLFDQLSRDLHLVSEAEQTGNALPDFRGHVVTTYALRSRATKLGYLRGESEDGGWFYSYDKRYPTLGLVVSVRFSGSPLPEADQEVALERLQFHRISPEGRWNAMKVRDVPAVLVSEAWHDMRAMAADGTGFDPDWEKRIRS